MESAILANSRDLYLGRAAYLFWDGIQSLSRFQTSQNRIEKYVQFQLTLSDLCYHIRWSKSTDKSGCLDEKIHQSLACFDE